MSEGSAFAGISFGYNSDAIFEYRKKHMCDKWKNTVHKEFMMCNVSVMDNNKGNYVFEGNIKSYLGELGNIQDIYIQFWAPSKPTRGYSFPGSGLPFPNEAIAYQDTTNKGAILITGGKFTFNLEYPNSYYSDMGKTYNPPQVKFQFCDGNGKTMSKVYTVILGDGIPYRTLNFTKKRDWNDGPLFYYNSRMPKCRNQFQILIESRYPETTMKESTNFWGLTPPR